MYQPSYSCLHRIDLAAECGPGVSCDPAPASGIEIRTSTTRMARLCSARQFGHELGEWRYGLDGRVSATCVRCAGTAALLYQDHGVVRVEQEIPYACDAALGARRAAG